MKGNHEKKNMKGSSSKVSPLGHSVMFKHCFGSGVDFWQTVQLYTYQICLDFSILKGQRSIKFRHQVGRLQVKFENVGSTVRVNHETK